MSEEKNVSEQAQGQGIGIEAMQEQQKKEIEMLEQQFKAQLEAIEKQYEMQLANIRKMQESRMKATTERHRLQLNSMKGAATPPGMPAGAPKKTVN